MSSLTDIHTDIYEKNVYVGSVRRDSKSDAQNSILERSGCFGKVQVPTVFRSLSRRLSRKSSTKSL